MITTDPLPLQAAQCLRDYDHAVWVALLSLVEADRCLRGLDAVPEVWIRAGASMALVANARADLQTARTILASDVAGARALLATIRGPELAPDDGIPFV